MVRGFVRLPAACLSCVTATGRDCDVPVRPREVSPGPEVRVCRAKPAVEGDRVLPGPAAPSHRIHPLDQRGALSRRAHARERALRRRLPGPGGAARVVQGSAGRRSRIRPPRPTRELRRTGLAHGSPDRVVRGLRPSRVRQRGSEDGGAAGPRDAVSRAGPSPRRWYPGRVRIANAGPGHAGAATRPLLGHRRCRRTHRPSAGAARTGPSRRRPASTGFGTTWTSAAAIRFFRSRRRTSCPAIAFARPLVNASGLWLDPRASVPRRDSPRRALAAEPGAGFNAW